MKEETVVEPMTLREIAETEGISHQAIAEILAKALKKAKKKLQDKQINHASDVI